MTEHEITATNSDSELGLRLKSEHSWESNRVISWGKYGMYAWHAIVRKILGLDEPMSFRGHKYM